VLAEGGVVAPPYDAGKTPPKPLTVASNQGSPDPFVGDAVGLYWIDSGGRRLVTAPFAGGTATLAADLHGPSALATDGTDAFVAETGSIYSGSVKGILRVPVAGGAGTLMLNGVSASELAAAGGLLYFVAQSAVQRVPTAGGTPEVLAKTNGIVFALAASGGCAVYVESGLRRVCEPSGSVDVLDPQGGSPIAVDAGEVIYVAYVSGGKQLRRIPDKGGSATTVADLRNEPLLAALAADATHVFVAYQGTSSKSYYDGIVDRVPRAGGVAESLATGQRDPSGLALDDTYVYWANRGNGTIVKTPKVSP
jgi:sugar lactone lactonase YvrE